MITETKQWWEDRGKKYNKGLIISGVIAFITYVILASFLIAPYENEFEITLFTIFFQGLAYIIMMSIANVLYGLGHYIDIHFNRNNSETYRQRLFNLGFWGSVGLPFLIPILVIISYFVRFA